MFAFYLIALFIAVTALFTGLLALCSRLGSYLSGLTTSAALFFQAIAATLMTAWTVQGRNAFRAAGRDAHLGVALMAFAWTSVACFFISTVLFCGIGAIGRRDSRGGGGMRRGRSVRSTRSTANRGSFFGADHQGRTKDGYS